MMSIRVSSTERRAEKKGKCWAHVNPIFKPPWAGWRLSSGLGRRLSDLRRNAWRSRPPPAGKQMPRDGCFIIREIPSAGPFAVSACHQPWKVMVGCPTSPESPGPPRRAAGTTLRNAEDGWTNLKGLMGDCRKQYVVQTGKLWRAS